MMQNKNIIGLTGDIGAGKSTASEYLINKKFKIIDADLISRQLALEADVLDEIKYYFNDVIIDGKLDRKKLAKIVFSNDMELAKLNSIMHPKIVSRINHLIQSSSDSIIFIDAPLLFEVGLDKICNHIIYIDVDKKTRIKRIIERDNITEELATKIMSKFDDKEEKKKKSFVVENNSTKKELYEKIENILKKII